MRRIHEWVLPRTRIALGQRTAIMGVLNVTPDSFSDGGRWRDPDKAVERALELEADGADILDVGGESSRPGSAAISVDEELRRVLPVLEKLAGRLRIPVSIDTYRAAVARRALEAGAQVINDISAFRFDSEMAEVAAKHKAGVVLMHSRGDRATLHSQPPMADPLREVVTGLQESAAAARRHGVAAEAIVVDPGIGFGKKADESVSVLRNIACVSSQLEYPVLVGTSRKSFIGKLVVQDGPEARLWGTAATVASSILQGSHIVRVHDVRPMRILVDVLDAIGAQ